MPFSDEKLYWKVRIPRRLRKPLAEQAKRLGFPSVDCLTAAVDNWLNMEEPKQKEAIDRWSTIRV